MVLGLLVGSTPAAAQPVVTLQGGLSASAYLGDAVSSPEWRAGPYAAVSLTLPLADLGGLRVGLAYARRGSDFLSSSGARVSIPLDLIQLPLTVQVGTPHGRRGRVFAFLGVEPSWRVACQHTVAGPIPTSRGCGEPVYVRRLLFEAAGGVGVRWRLPGGRRITLEVAYHHGLSSVYDSGIGVKTRALTGAVGVDLPLG